MYRRPSALLLASWLLVPGLSLADDDELDPEKVARIRREEAAALSKVNEAHGNKKSSEMDNAERRQLIQEQQDASAGVLQKHGVTAKEYANHTARMGPEGNKAVAAAEARLEAEEKAKKEAEAQKKSEPQEVVIQQGISDKNPVTLEGPADDAEPLIEQGTGEAEPTRVAEAEQPAVEKKKPARREKSAKKKTKKKRRSRDDSESDSE